MRRQDQQQDRSRTTGLTVWVPVIAAMGIMLTGCLGTFFVLRMDAFRPTVGDLVVFRPSPPDSDLWQTRVTATERGPQRDSTCVLDPGVMSVSGGSLIVESRQDVYPPIYRIHWAGGRTSQGADDCGTAADVTVTRVDLQKLANAAGGFGLRNKGVPN